MQFTQEQIDRHNQLVDAASKLIQGEIHLDNRELPPPGWFVRRRLEKARAKYLSALRIAPTKWNSMFFLAKIEQRLGRKEAALDWLLCAREFEPNNTSVAKEAAMMASKLGDHAMAARIADEAIPFKPDDAALYVNAGVARLLNGQIEEAIKRLQEAVKLEPERTMNRQLASYAEMVRDGTRRLPRDEREILEGIRTA